MSLENLCTEIANCDKCKLSTTRTKTVPGEGPQTARLMICGEGPGKDEDTIGRPFCGRSGNLLTYLIERELGLNRITNVFITNLVKCRPTVDFKGEKDRAPTDEELALCTPYLLRQIEIVKPKVIVALGGPAAKFFLQEDLMITKRRGKWSEFHGIPVMPTYHPSYVLRNGGIGSPQYRDMVTDLLKIAIVI